jgi:transposase InsO family protein
MSLPPERSRTPQYRRGCSPPRRPRTREVVVERVVERVVAPGTTTYPTLTKTNYNDWALLMKVKMQARGLWEAVEIDDVDDHHDRMALDVICSTAPPEMVSTLAVKPTAKDAWEALKTLRIGDERVRKSTAQRLRREYEMLSFRDSESVEAFALRLTDVVAQLAMLGDPESPEKVVEKYLRIARPRYKQLVISIETLLDVSTLTVEDITGRLKAAEDADDAPPPSTGGKLYLTEEQWEARRKEQQKGGDAGTSKSGDRRRHPRRGVPASSGRTGTGPGRKLGRDQCRKCGQTGHWARDCKARPKQEAAHMAQEEEALMLLRAAPLRRSPPAGSATPPAPGGSVTPPPPGGSAPPPLPPPAASAPPPLPPLAGSAPPPPPAGSAIAPPPVSPAPSRTSSPSSPYSPPPHDEVLGAPSAVASCSSQEATAASSDGRIQLQEGKVFVQLDAKEQRDPTSWICDTGATNHMTGSRAAFADLDTAVSGSVRFGDDSMAEIEGRGTVLFKCKNGEHRSFTAVYYIPRLTANIVSLGQLEEADYDVHIRRGGMEIREPEGRLLARIPRAGNRLYVLNVDVPRPVCLAARGEESAWRWHARLGHINMLALRKMAREELVRGLPSIEQVDQLCEACLAGKQRRTAFPDQTQWRADRALELVHGDLCGPVTPATPSRNTYFLLLVDDRSRFMWLTLLRSKDRAAAAIKEFQARVEAESGCKLLALQTDRGGEFTSKEFMEYCAADGVHRQLTAPYSPQQNGVVERRNAMVAGTARCLLKAKGLPAWFWGEAVNTAVYLLNRVPTKAVEGKTPVTPQNHIVGFIKVSSKD